MTNELPDVLNVLIFRGDVRTIDRIKAVAPDRLNVIDVSADFNDELAAEWPARMLPRLPEATPRSVEEREAVLREAHVALMGLPFPKTMPSRAPALRWAHFPFAGVSNLMGSDWWGVEGPTITSSRGATNALPIAETTIAAALMLAKKLDLGVQQTAAGEFDGRPFAAMKLVQGKTMAIVGLGGIGSQVARLARAVGMRAVATRRSALERQTDTDGVDVLYPASQLHDMLAEADFVAVCTMWTPETAGLIDAAAFAALKPGAFILNVARGEIIDEPAMLDALASGKLAGAYLDVWQNDFASPPSPELLATPNVVFTPHVSGRADVSHAFGVEVFCRNLAHLLAGEALENIVDWSRGY